MKETMPRVSVGLPVYNGENYLAEAIEAILGQTTHNFELIISDNGSTDGTEDICRAYASMDARIRYYRSDENHGAAWNFNRVLSLARGTYFKWIAHDDRVRSDFLEKCLEVLDTDASVVISYSRVNIIDELGQVVREYDVKLVTDDARPPRRFRDLLMEWHLCFEIFGLIRMDALDKVGPMGSYSHGDGVLLGRLSLLGRFHEIPECLIEARQHPSQSMNAYGVYADGENDYHKYAVWFDTAKRGRLVFPTWRMLGEHARSPWLVPLSARDRLMSELVVGRWAVRRRYALLQDLKFAGRFLFQQARQAAGNAWARFRLHSS